MPKNASLNLNMANQNMPAPTATTQQVRNGLVSATAPATAVSTPTPHAP